MKIYKPKDYGQIGEGDDTPAINAALQAIRDTNMGGILELEGEYHVGALNATSIGIGIRTCLEIQAAPHTKLIGGLSSIPAAILDLTETRARIIGELEIIGGDNVLSAILIAKSDMTVLDGCLTNGSFIAGAVSIINGFEVQFRGGQYMNTHETAPCINISVNPDWYITSLFHDWPIGYTNCEDIYFFGTEIHGLYTSQWTVYMRSVRHVVFDGGICDNSGIAHILFQGHNSHITTIGHKYYSEMGRPSAYVYHCNETIHSCDNLKVLNPYHDSIPVLIQGPGAFPNFWTI